MLSKLHPINGSDVFFGGYDLLVHPQNSIASVGTMVLGFNFL
jgi:hypothetical protein